jgi:hypothetical protein
VVLADEGVAAKAWRQAERACAAWSAAATAWREVAAALRLFTPAGALNTRVQAAAALQAALPRLSGPEWSKVRRALQRPQLLTFLDQAAAGLLPRQGSSSSSRHAPRDGAASRGA